MKGRTQRHASVTAYLLEVRTVQDSSKLSEECANPLGAFRDLDVEQLLDGERVAELVCHWTRSQFQFEVNTL